MAALVAMLVAACLVTPAAAPAAKHRHRLVAGKVKVGKVVASRGGSARARRRLADQLRRDPKVLLKPGFLRKAAAADMALPITVRLTSPGQLFFTPATDSFAWPTPPDAGVVQPAADPQPVQLSGMFGMQLEFGADTSGYGLFGALETSQGQFALLNVTSSMRLYDDAICGGAGLQTKQPVTLTSDALSYGVIDLVNSTISGSLKLNSRFTAERAAFDGGCGAPPTWSDVATTDPVPLSAPIPVPYEGSARISPGYTFDGKLRLGVVDLHAPAGSQGSAFSLLRVCRGAGPCNAFPSPQPAPSGNGPFDRFPFRVSVDHVAAELLVGVQA